MNSPGKVLELSKKNIGINVGTSVGINKTEKSVLGILIRNPEKTAEEMAAEVGVSKRKIERALVNEDSLRFHLALGFEEANRIICFRKGL